MTLGVTYIPPMYTMLFGLSFSNAPDSYKDSKGLVKALLFIPTTNTQFPCFRAGTPTVLNTQYLHHAPYNHHLNPYITEPKPHQQGNHTSRFLG